MPPARPISSGLIFSLLACMSLTGLSTSADDGPTPNVFPELLWQVDRRVPGVRKVFPSPIDPDVVLVSSDEGLRRTRTGGADWELLPKTSPAVLGTVSDVAFCPARPEFVVLGSGEKGVFVSRNGGTSWRRGGGVASGLSSLTVTTVAFSRADRAWETLLVCHGADGPGISRSIDGGRTWRVIAPARHFRSVVGWKEGLAGSSSTADEPDNWQIARSRNYGESWHDIRRDVMPVVGVSSSLKPTRIVWGSRGGRLLVSTDAGASYVASKSTTSGRWNAVFVTPGRTPGEEWFWAYDPFRIGLVCGRDFEKPWVSRNRGLYVDRMIKRGAVAAANACGTRFFACVNGRLYVGDHVASADAPIIRQAKTVPSALRIHRLTAEADSREAVYQSSDRLVKGAPVDGELTRIIRVARRLRAIRSRRRYALHVRVEHPKGPDAVRSVTVTPDIFGLGEIALFDDGKHGDGKATDGVWGGAFRFTEEQMWNARRLVANARNPFPGTRGIPVTAADEAGNKTSWTLPVSMFFTAKPWQLRCDSTNRNYHVTGSSFAEGNVSLRVTDDPKSAEGKTLEVTGKKGPWRAYRAANGGEGNLTGLRYVTFVFDGAPGSGDIAFFLVAQLTGRTHGEGRQAFEPKRFSDEVFLLKERHLAAMDGGRHRVKIPIAKLVGNRRFARRHVAGFGLRAAPGAPGGTYHITEVTFTNE